MGDDWIKELSGEVERQDQEREQTREESRSAAEIYKRHADQVIRQRQTAVAELAGRLRQIRDAVRQAGDRHAEASDGRVGAFNRTKKVYGWYVRPSWNDRSESALVPLLLADTRQCFRPRECARRVQGFTMLRDKGEQVMVSVQNPRDGRYGYEFMSYDRFAQLVFPDKIRYDHENDCTRCTVTLLNLNS